MSHWLWALVLVAGVWAAHSGARHLAHPLKSSEGSGAFSERKMLHTSSIISTEANKLVRPIYDRMPVFPLSYAEELWLDENGFPDRLLSLLRPYKADEMKAFAISTLMNSPLEQRTSGAKLSINLAEVYRSKSF